MANKNTRWIRNQVRRAGLRGEKGFEFKVPVKDYHNHPNDGHPERWFFLRTHPTHRMNEHGEISHNQRRNSCQRVLHNVGENRRTASLTCHEAWIKNEPMVHKNHKYLKYGRQVVG